VEAASASIAVTVVTAVAVLGDVDGCRGARSRFEVITGPLSLTLLHRDGNGLGAGQGCRRRPVTVTS